MCKDTLHEQRTLHEQLKFTSPLHPKKNTASFFISCNLYVGYKKHAMQPIGYTFGISDLSHLHFICREDSRKSQISQVKFAIFDPQRVYFHLGHPMDQKNNIIRTFPFLPIFYGGAPHCLETYAIHCFSIKVKNFERPNGIYLFVQYFDKIVHCT